LQKIPKTGES